MKLDVPYIVGSHEGFVVFNADGIYLTTYVTLLLNFELTRRGYYPSCCGFVSQSEVRPTIFSSAEWQLKIFFFKSDILRDFQSLFSVLTITINFRTTSSPVF